MEEAELIDIADDLLIINKTTIERLFQEENTDVVVLYMFYYKTAKWQKHNPIKATDDYCQKCLKWGLKRVKNIKKRLKEMELITVEKRKNEKSQIDGWYVRINYYVDSENSSGSISSGSVSPLVAKRDHNILLNNNINTINNINTNNTTTNTIFDFLQENGFILTPIQIEIVSQWEDNELTRYAIKKAVLNNKFNINYINTILNSYEKNNITTLQQAIEDDENFNTKRERYYKNKYEVKETRYERERRLLELDDEE